MSTKSLPTSVSLTQLRNQARDLSNGHKAGDVSVCARIRAHFPKLNDASDDAILQFNFVLQNAQLAIAREYGFKSWPQLKTHIETLASFDRDVDAFKQAFDAGDAATREKVRQAKSPWWRKDRFEDPHEEVLNKADARVVVSMERGHVAWTQHECYLYLAEPVRDLLPSVEGGDLEKVQQILEVAPEAANPHWVGGYVPPDYPSVPNESVPLFMLCQGVLNGTSQGNDYKIARALIAAGADIHINDDAPLGNAASFGAINAARAFVEAGAPIDGPNEPLLQALFFGFTELSEFLADQGAELDMRFAAGLGKLETVKGYFNVDSSLKPGAGRLGMMFSDVHGPHPQRTREVILHQAMLFASLHGRHEVMEFLLEQGADIDALVLESDWDATCLQRVCCHTADKGISSETMDTRRLATAEFLLDHGATVDKTAQNCARRSGYEKILALLQGARQATG